jgi:hypothetical protein
MTAHSQALSLAQAECCETIDAVLLIARANTDSRNLSEGGPLTALTITWCHLMYGIASVSDVCLVGCVRLPYITWTRRLSVHEILA